MAHVLCSLPAAIPTQRATACVHDRIHEPVYFLFTSTPDRAQRLPRVLAMLRRQTLVPNAAVLTIAATYDTARFRNASFDMRLLERLAPASSEGGTPSSSKPQLIVHRLAVDRGPVSKYFGAVRSRVPANAIVVVGDDDLEYGSSFIEDYACAVAGGPESTVYSSGIDTDCRRLGGCVMGFRGVAMRAAMLHALPATPIPRACYLADDVAITHYLTRAPHAFAVRRLRLRSKYRFDESVAWLNSSINAYHRERQFKVNRACIAALFSKADAEGADEAGRGRRGTARAVRSAATARLATRDHQEGVQRAGARRVESARRNYLSDRLRL